MRLKTNQLFYLLKKQNGNWEYVISEYPMLLSSINGCLQLNNSEYVQITDLLSHSKDGITFKLGDLEYSILFSGEFDNSFIGKNVYNNIEDISERIFIEDLTKKEDNSIANKFIKRAKEKNLKD